MRSEQHGIPFRGMLTPAVKRQWCGRTGKIDNGVMSVHTGYTAGAFQCLLDSDVFLPEDWADEATRRQATHIPDAVVYRKKTDIGLAQIQRALKNGIRVAAWTFDEGYGRDGSFLDGLDALGQNYVAEVPVTFTGWLHEPKVLQRPTPQAMRKRGRKRHFPRLARKASPACEVRNLVTYSCVFQKQKWRRWHIKDGENGPMVWEVKSAMFYRKLATGLPSQPHCLIVARDVLNPEKIKYFIANRVPDAEGVSLAWLLYVGLSRWPIEHCFRQTKNELGLDHFEVRGWRSIHRHLYITQLSHLFCSRVHQERGEKTTDGEHLTVEPVRDAASAWVEAQDLPRSIRRQQYGKAARRIAYHQRRNRQARASHTKTTRRTLRKLGLRVDRLPSCVPDDP